MRVSRPFTRDGVGIVTFGPTPRTVVQGNRTGITLRGSTDNATRVTNTDVISNTISGIVLESGEHQIGTALVVANAVNAGDVILASWPTVTNTRVGSQSLTLPASFAGGNGLKVGAPVFGPGIAQGTKVDFIVPPAGRVLTWQIGLTKPIERTVSSASLSFGVMDAANPSQVRRITIATASHGRVVVGQSLHGEGVPEFTTVVGIRLGMNPLLQDDYVILSAPRAGLSVADQVFANLAGGLLLSQRTVNSNRVYGNGQYGLDVRQPALGSRFIANYFGMLGELNIASPNRLGDVRFDGVVPPEYVPGVYDRVDQKANRYGLSLDPGTNPGGNPPPPPGGGLNPIPPRDPVL
jgi:hypothetical protein